MEASGGNSGRSSAAGSHSTGGHKANGGDRGRVAGGGRKRGRGWGLHPGTREASSGPIILLHHVMPKDSNPVPMRQLRLSQVASHNPKDTHKKLKTRE